MYTNSEKHNNETERVKERDDDDEYWIRLENEMKRGQLCGSAA